MRLALVTALLCACSSPPDWNGTYALHWTCTANCDKRTQLEEPTEVTIYDVTSETTIGQTKKTGAAIWKLDSGIAWVGLSRATADDDHLALQGNFTENEATWFELVTLTDDGAALADPAAMLSGPAVIAYQLDATRE